MASGKLMVHTEKRLCTLVMEQSLGIFGKAMGGKEVEVIFSDPSQEGYGVMIIVGKRTKDGKVKPEHRFNHSQYRASGDEVREIFDMFEKGQYHSEIRSLRRNGLKGVFRFNGKEIPY